MSTRKLIYRTSINNEHVAEEIKSRETGKVYEVYWIRKSDHTDVKTQGYVGITCQGVRKRYHKHVSEAASKVQEYVFHRALRKYGRDNLVADVLCICDEEYARYLEYCLRPDDFIGWNTTQGGLGNSKGLREVTSSDEFSKMRSDHMYSAWQNEDYRGKLLSSRKDYFNSVPAWRRRGNAVNHFAWSLAGKFYTLYKELGWKKAKICNYMMVDGGSFCRIYDYIVAGWNPLEDEDYCEKYPPKTYDEIIDEFGDPNQYHLSWQRSGASDAWRIADTLKDVFDSGGGVKDIAKEAGVTWHQAHKIHRRFTKGWSPLEDPRWLRDFKGYEHEYK